MGKTRPAYQPEFRRQMVELVRAGRSPEERAREFEPTAQSIRLVSKYERNAGRGDGGLMTAELEDHNRLRRENRQLRLERCRFKTQSEARSAVFAFIEGFYNPRRRRSSKCHETRGQHDVKPESLIPSSHLSTKPG